MYLLTFNRETRLTYLAGANSRFTILQHLSRFVHDVPFRVQGHSRF